MHRNLTSLTVFAVTGWVVTSVAFSAPITVPPGLQLGDQYRLVFVTSSEHDAVSSDVSVYNAFVANVAAGVSELTALGTTWKAIVSTEFVSARDNTGTNPLVNAGVPVYRLDGTKIANNNDDLWHFTGIDANISTNEQGAIVAKDVWSGTNLDGTTDMLSPVGSINSIIYGTTYGSPEFWLYAGGASGPNSLHALYAMSGLLTAVPEPSTWAMSVLGLIGLAGYGLRRTRAGITVR